MKLQILDPFADISAWQAIASGQVELKLSVERQKTGQALRLDYDFKGGGGFAVARKVFSLRLPEEFAFRFRLRGTGPANHFEFKLVDDTGRNVWRHQKREFLPPVRWRSHVLREGDLEFAWGPAGGGVLSQLGAVEFAIVAGPGGRGTLWLADLAWEDRTLAHPPAVTASSAQPGFSPEKAIDGLAETHWLPLPNDTSPWIALDLGERRDLGGLIIDWQPSAPPEGFTLLGSNDGIRWRPLYQAHHARLGRNYLRLPKLRTQHLRLEFASADGGKAVSELSLQTQEFARSPQAFFHAVAAREPRGAYPRWLLREQSYWTPAARPNGTHRALINEEGMVEVDEASFLIEPLVQIGNRMHTWATTKQTQELEFPRLPMPAVVWHGEGCNLRVTAFASGLTPQGATLVRYRLENHTAEAVSGKLFLAVRPFQVTPPWQSLGKIGGLSPIRRLSWNGRSLTINGRKKVIPLQIPSAAGGMEFDEGNVAGLLCAGGFPTRVQVTDRTGFASAALRFDLSLPPHGHGEVLVAVPFGEGAGANEERTWHRAEGSGFFAAAVQEWQATQQGPILAGAGWMEEVIESMWLAAAHIRMTRDGPALQPGPRRYSRSWIRDGVCMGTALLRMGDPAPLRDFLQWYAPYQRADGLIPCCVDRHGPDWLLEYDSQGQFMAGVLTVYHQTSDAAFLAEMWPHVLSAVDYTVSLRKQRLTPAYEAPDRRSAYGLLPESASHEGYLAHPVHSYWDDFWAVRGLRDAAQIARLMNAPALADEWAAQADDLARALWASISLVRSQGNLDFIPASVEWADFDPTATAVAFDLLDPASDLPAEAVEATFTRYMTDWRRKRTGELDWANYTAYEVRIVGALVRLGRRADALELLRFLLKDQRPSIWRQWPEITWRNPLSPGHLGDLPHTWIAGEFILSARSLFAFESQPPHSLVLAAGVDAAWLAQDGLHVENFPTSWGLLSFSIRLLPNGVCEAEVSGPLRPPAGGIELRPPLSGPIFAATVNGLPAANAGGNSVTFFEVPAQVRIHTSAASIHAT